MNVSDPNNKPSAPNIILVGLSIVFITAYAPFTIASFISKKIPDVPLEVLVSSVFFSMAVGTFLSAGLTRTGLIVAPSVGIAALIKLTSPESVSFAQALLATVGASCIALYLSRSPSNGQFGSIRRQILDSIPPPIKAGVRGGIGALLAVAAYSSLAIIKEKDLEHYNIAIFAVVFGVAAILIAEALQRRLETMPEYRVSILMLLLRSSNFIVPIVTFFVLNVAEIVPLPGVRSEFVLPSQFSLWNIEWPQNKSEGLKNILMIGVFTLVILFVLITDIPGSPYDLLQEFEDEKKSNDLIDRSFQVQSLVSAVNPFLNLFTSVYYAENHIITRDEESKKALGSPAPAYLAGTVFLLFAALMFCLDFNFVLMSLWLPVVVAAPLFCLGIRLTARALLLDATDAKMEARVSRRSRTSASEGAHDYGDHIPVAVIIITSHFLGFELALPLGILYFNIYRSGVTKDPLVLRRATSVVDHETNPDDRIYEKIIIFGAFVVALVLSMVRLGYA